MILLFLKYHFIAMQLTGICLFLTLSLKKSPLVRFDWSKVSQFVGFMVLVEFIRMGLMDGDPNFKVEPDDPLMGLSTNIWVFWEDSFFAMPIYFLKDHLKLHKSIWIPVAVGLSLLFASLHINQGYVWAAIVGIYPFFISYRFGKVNGFGTVMACHIIYDVATHLGYKIMCLIKLMPA